MSSIDELTKSMDAVIEHLDKMMKDHKCHHDKDKDEDDGGQELNAEKIMSLLNINEEEFLICGDFCIASMIAKTLQADMENDFFKCRVI